MKIGRTFKFIALERAKRAPHLGARALRIHRRIFIETIFIKPDFMVAGAARNHGEAVLLCAHGYVQQIGAIVFQALLQGLRQVRRIADACAPPPECGGQCDKVRQRVGVMPRIPSPK